MSKIKIIILVIIIVLVGLGCFRFFKLTPKEVTKGEDFTIRVNNRDYNVVVAKPSQKSERYPLVIYHHGEGYKTIEPFELREIAQRLADAGFLVWIPERNPGGPGKDSLTLLQEAKEVSKEILSLALNDSEVDKNNINIVGFGSGAWAAAEENIYSSKVKSISLLGFGLPLTNAVLYDQVNNLVQEIDCSRVSPKIFIMVSKDDYRVKTTIAETLRQKLAQVGKQVDCLEYARGGHQSLAGNKDYLIDLINYLQGKEIPATEIIETNKKILEEMEIQQREGGYW